MSQAVNRVPGELRPKDKTYYIYPENKVRQGQASSNNKSIQSAK